MSMKKFKFVFFTLLLFIPMYVKAYEIENYYIDATIESNGDLLVQEYFNMTGDFNGFGRIIEYVNDDLYEYDDTMNSFGGSTIHNGTGLEILEVRAVSIDSTFDFTNIGGDVFTESNSASKGDYGVYVEDDIFGGKSLFIYNSSSYHKAFYIKYRLKDMAIRHNDVGEIGWNIIGNETSESVRNFKACLHIPGNKNIRAWAHGPLNGNVQIVDSQTVLFTINNLSSYRAVDIRATFDLNVISESKKYTYADALDKIILYENDLAKQANYKRLLQRVEPVLCMIVFLILGILVYRRYYYSKITFDQKYYRSIDDDYIPTTVSYLFHKKITKRALSASILDLIRRKIITVQKKGENNYKLILNKEYNDTIPPVYDKLVKFIFNKRSSIETKDIKKYSKKECESYHINWSNYHNQCLNIAKQCEFYESDIEKPKKKKIQNVRNLNKSKNVKSKKYDKIFFLLPFFLIPLIPLILLLGRIFLPTDVADAIDKLAYIIGLIIGVALPSVTVLLLIVSLIVSAPDSDEDSDFKKLVFGIIYVCIIVFCVYKLKSIANLNYYTLVYFIILIGSIVSLIILRKTYKRTEKGMLEYKKWKAIKRFLNDFGSFQDKEVMEVTLWEKYLVYATLFGCSKKILKVMKLNSIDDYSSISGDMYCDLQFSKCVIGSVHSAYKASSRSHTSSSSRNSSSNSDFGGSFSSGGGSGGGFSSGGGSFGGGGGGGRF